MHEPTEDDLKPKAFDEPEPNMDPDPRYAFHYDDPEPNMEPDPKYAYQYDEPEPNMEPSTKYVIENSDGSREIGPYTEEEFRNPFIDIRPMPDDRITLEKFKRKYPSFYDENGMIKTEALEIIDGLVSMYMKSKKGDTDTQHLEKEYIIENEQNNGYSR